MCKKLLFFSFCLVLLVFLTSCSEEDNNPLGGDEGEDESMDLQVNVDYTGLKTINSVHPIGICVFKKADASQSEYTKSLLTASGSVTFTDIGFTPCYVSVIYDYDNNHTISHGESYENYNNTGFTRNEIDLTEGKKKSIDVAFNDTYIKGYVYHFNIGATTYDMKKNCIGFYKTAGLQTYIQGSSGTPYINIHFIGNSTGTYLAPDTVIDYYNGTAHYSVDAVHGSCSVTVTNYSSIGQLIEGYFNAHATNTSGSDSVDIINGVFSVSRCPNQ